MSLQWHLVAGMLYAEIAFLFLMMIPWIRPPTWYKIFNCRIVKFIEAYSRPIYWYSLGGILVVLFMDAVREVMKYSNPDLSVEDKFAVPHADTMIHMRLFRAQRNLYIAGFAAFLYLVVRRMMQLIMQEARLMGVNKNGDMVKNGDMIKNGGVIKSGGSKKID